LFLPYGENTGTGTIAACCLDCMWMRAGQRGVRLSLVGLKPVPVNLVCDSWSWFDLLEIGRHKLSRNFNLQAWRKAAEGCSPHELPRFFKGSATREQQLDWHRSFARRVSTSLRTPCAVQCSRSGSETR